MTKTTKRLSIATATACLLAASMTGALAQAPSDPHHPQDAPAAGAPAAQGEPTPQGHGVAPTDGGGMQGMMGDAQMPMMKMMQEMHGKMMGAGMGAQPTGDTGPSSQAFNGITARMRQETAITFTGNADIDFVKEMIPLHQGEVDMAKTVLAFGKDPEIKKAAEEAIKTQEAEIAWMKEWLKKQAQ